MKKILVVLVLALILGFSTTVIAASDGKLLTRKSAVPVKENIPPYNDPGVIAAASIPLAGSIEPQASLPDLSDLVFIPFQPCRILDTRNVSGGHIPGGTTRDFFAIEASGSDIANQGGKAGGCGVPTNASAIAVTLTATQEDGPGNLRAWPYSASMPTASCLNYMPGVNIANTTILPICFNLCAAEFSIYANVNGTDLVADVVGYFIKQVPTTPGVAIVAPSGGNYTDPVTAMAHLSAWCPAPSFASPCLLKLMPGLYNIGSNNLAMQPYVDLEGSGEEVTTIIGNNSTTNGVLRGASNAEIRFLSAINTGGGALSIAISSIDQSPKINHVTATAAFGVESHGIHNSNASPTMTNVTVSAGAQTSSYRVFNTAGSVPILSRMNIFATGGSLYNVGVWNEDSAQAYVGDTVAKASGGTYAIGFYSVNTAGPAQLNRSAFQASGGAGFSQAIRNDSSQIIQVGSSTVIGGFGGVGPRQCIFCFDTNYLPLGSNCQ